jgi:hypothetical protein
VYPRLQTSHFTALTVAKGQKGSIALNACLEITWRRKSRILAI